MSLLVLATELRKIAGACRDSLKPALRVLTRVYKQHGWELTDPEMKTDGMYRVISNDRPLIYSVKRTTNGIYFWTRTRVDEALDEGIEKLHEVGIPAIRKDKGILISESCSRGGSHTPDDVATHCGGSLLTSEHGEDDSWHTIRRGGKTFSFCFEPAGRHLQVRCGKGQIDLTAKFNLSEESSKKIGDAITYQAAVYDKIFNPETYGLVAQGSPIRMKKHFLLPCDKGTLVVSPSSHAYLLTAEGQYSLMKPEGAIGLKPNAAFKTIRSSNIKFEDGPIARGFKHLLQRRGHL